MISMVKQIHVATLSEERLLFYEIYSKWSFVQDDQKFSSASTWASVAFPTKISLIEVHTILMENYDFAMKTSEVNNTAHVAWLNASKGDTSLSCKVS